MLKFFLKFKEVGVDWALALALSGLKIALEEKLDKKIDIVEFSSLDPSLAESIKDEVIMIYEQG